MSFNEPQWGKRPQDGPPDLDEMWRRFNRRLNDLFNGNGGGMGGPAAAGTLTLLLILMGLLWCASGFYIVEQPERGIVLRFGRYLETTDPGLRWHLPFPIETREIVNISQVRTVEIGYSNNVKSKVAKEALMLTDDENIIDLQMAVQYVLKDPADYLFNNREVEDTVKQVAETAIREIVGRNTMDFVLYEGREQVAVDASKSMQEILDRYKTGIQISKVTMQNAQPPEPVQASFDDAVKAGQDRERQKNEGQAYANDIIPRARGLAARLMEEASGYKQRVIATAEGDASRFTQILTEYQKAPGVTRDRMYLDMMQQVLSNTNKVVVDQKNGSNLLYLPLDKLVQMATPPTEPPARPTQIDPAPSAVERERNRDNARRERESR